LISPHTAIGYGEKWLDAETETNANTVKAALDAFTALIADARAGRPFVLWMARARSFEK